jgi:hypothetical protein
LKELPRVLLVSIVVVPFVLPPALVVLLGTVVFKIVEGIAWIFLKAGEILGPKLGMKRPPKQVNPPSFSFRT